MTTPLFSTYSQGENRVTATFLAVLERLSVANMNRIFEGLLGDEEFGLVTFANQPRGVDSIPDAKIETGHSVWIETKIERDKVGVVQIRNHMKAVKPNEKLLVLTPDDDRPTNLDSNSISKNDRERIVWANFRKLDNIVSEILDSKDAPPLSMDDYLLREFSSFLDHEALTISSADRVAVASAGWAWPAYNALGKVAEPFISGYRAGYGLAKPSNHIAFYTGQEIKIIVPKVKSVVGPINFTRQVEIDSLEDSQERELANEIFKRIKQCNEIENFNAETKIIFLSGPDDPETITLDKPIANDLIGKGGKRVGWVMKGQRYVTLDSLKTASKTSDLKLC